MSLLSVCQGVAAEVGMGGIPSAIAGSSAPLAVQMKALANRAGKTLAGSFAWPALMAEFPVDTVSGTADYALPTDYAGMVSETAWDATNYWRMRGALTPAEWQAWKRGIVTPSTVRRFRVRAGRLWIFPTPDVSGDDLIFEYLTNAWVQSSGVSPTYRTSFADDADTTRFPEDLLALSLKWRLLEAKGLPYGDAQQEFAAQLRREQAYAAPAERINLQVNTRGHGQAMPNIPATVPSP